MKKTLIVLALRAINVAMKSKKMPFPMLASEATDLLCLIIWVVSTWFYTLWRLMR